MTGLEFSVIKYVPDLVRFEPVNVGVSLLDKDSMTVHNRFVTDFGQFFSRLGIKRINGLEKSFEGVMPTISVDSADYLWKMYEEANGSMFYSKPTSIVDSKGSGIETVLGMLFDKMISVQ